MRRGVACGGASLAIALGSLAVGCGWPWGGPRYTMEQTDSTHPGHRRTTVEVEGTVFVNDFEEAALELENVEPQEVIARSRFGGGTVRVIPGQSATAYVAVDVGSMMPAFAVYRHVEHPPFDWRHATFRKMRLAALEGPAANKETTDPAILDDVLSTLRDGAPASPSVEAPPTPIPGPARFHALLLFSDEIPGLIFRPWIYLADSGEVYLAGDATIEFRNREQSVRAAWIRASSLLADWARTP